MNTTELNQQIAIKNDRIKEQDKRIYEQDLEIKNLMESKNKEIRNKGYNFRLPFFSDEEIEDATRKGLPEQEKCKYIRLRYLAYRIAELEQNVSKLERQAKD